MCRSKQNSLKYVLIFFYCIDNVLKRIESQNAVAKIFTKEYKIMNLINIVHVQYYPPKSKIRPDAIYSHTLKI